MNFLAYLLKLLNEALYVQTLVLNVHVLKVMTPIMGLVY